MCSSACTSSPRRCCSDRCHGPSSLTCSSSRRRRSKKGFPTRTARGATCPARPTSPSSSAALANSPGTTDQGDTHADLRLHDPVRRLRTLRRHLPVRHHAHRQDLSACLQHRAEHVLGVLLLREGLSAERDRKSTRLNSSHGYISYAVFCLKKKKK